MPLDEKKIGVLQIVELLVMLLTAKGGQKLAQNVYTISWQHMIMIR